MLDKQEAREKVRCFIRRKLVGGIFSHFCCKKHCKRSPWRGTDTARAHFGAEAPENKPRLSHWCTVCWGWPCCCPAGRTTRTPLVTNNSLSPFISTQQGFWARSICLSILFLLPCLSLRDILFSKSKKKFGPACTWSKNLSGSCQTEKSLCLLVCFPSTESRQTWGSSTQHHVLVHCGALSTKRGFRHPLFLHPCWQLYVLCLDAWLFPVKKLGNHTLNFGSGIAKQEPTSFQGNLFHNLDCRV